MNPDWKQLAVDLTKIDAARALSFWAWLIEKDAQPLTMSMFGDWFLQMEGRVFRLDVLEGTFLPVASSVEEFERRKQLDHELVDWFQDGMCYALFRSGLIPGPVQCFGYKIPPVIGGSLQRENICLVEIVSWQLFISQLHHQVQQLPPNARIRRLNVAPNGLLTIDVE